MFCINIKCFCVDIIGIKIKVDKGKLELHLQNFRTEIWKGDKTLWSFLAEIHSWHYLCSEFYLAVFSISVNLLSR